jgi:hypothetical protein
MASAKDQTRKGTLLTVTFFGKGFVSQSQTYHPNIKPLRVLQCTLLIHQKKKKN